MTCPQSVVEKNQQELIAELEASINTFVAGKIQEGNFRAQSASEHRANFVEFIVLEPEIFKIVVSSENVASDSRQQISFQVRRKKVRQSLKGWKRNFCDAIES